MFSFFGVHIRELRSCALGKNITVFFIVKPAFLLTCTSENHVHGIARSSPESPIQNLLCLVPWIVIHSLRQQLFLLSNSLGESQRARSIYTHRIRLKKSIDVSDSVCILYIETWRAKYLLNPETQARARENNLERECKPFPRLTGHAHV